MSSFVGAVLLTTIWKEERRWGQRSVTVLMSGQYIQIGGWVRVIGGSGLENYYPIEAQKPEVAALVSDLLYDFVVFERPALHSVGVKGQHWVGQTDDRLDLWVEPQFCRLSATRLQFALKCD